jgi:hypothetical protein
MGLDMHLSKKTYVQNWDHHTPEERHEVIVKKGGKLVETIKAHRVKYIEEEVAYWRKANHIHKWFVDNVQGGEDNCNQYYVENGDLVNLLEVCKKVKEDPSKAEELLPTTEGFFFGSTDYNEYYMKDIDYTIEILEEAISEYELEAANKRYNGDYFYSSSW